MQRNSVPLPWSPHGVSDALDIEKTFPGAMSALSNLIPDPTTTDLWQCRPAGIRLTNFAPFNTPGFISCMRVVGDNVFGLLQTQRNPGFDEPFVFNLLTNTFTPITGVTGLNVPANVASSGAWVPPTMDVIGARVVVTHPGFGATAFFFGWFDISNPAAITWNAGNTAGAVVLTTVPSYVAQFNGRAYFIVNLAAQPAVVFSDPLNAIQVTNATQVITFGDAVKLTALGQLRLWNQAGGIIQGLIVFKGVANCYQVTGDSALGTLAINALNVATGTLAPLAIAATPKGLAFVSPDGIRIIDFQGNVSPAVGEDGRGVSVPFIYAVVPSRIVMAASGDLVRVGLQNGLAVNTAFQEWWYDISRQTWSGPQTFVPSLIQPYNNTFIVAPQGLPGTLYQCDQVQSTSSSFIEAPDTQTRILMQFDGANNATFFPDDSVAPHLFTANGTAKLDTGTKKFGSASLKLDGTGSCETTTPFTADLAMGTGDFTLEGFFNCNVALGGFPGICGQRGAAATNAVTAFGAFRDNLGHISFIICDGVNFFQITGTTVFSDVTNPGFHHWAVTRQTGVVRLFIDGVQEGGNLNFASAVNPIANPFTIGRVGDQAGTEWVGWLDCTRYIVGRAVYTANFTPPAAPFSFLSTTPLAWTYATANLPDTQDMTLVSVSQTLLHAALAANTTYQCTLVDPNGVVLNTVPISLSGGVSIWGAFTWGVGLWGSAGGALLPRIVPWTKKNVFAKAVFQVQGNSNSTVRLGKVFFRYRRTKHLENLGAVG